MRRMVMLPWSGLLMALALLYIGCDSTEPEETPNEEELITTVSLQLTGGGQTVAAVWNDADGEGGNNPTVQTLTLKAGTTYTGTITLTDDTAGEDITAEVADEADEHQFFYIPQGGVASQMTVTIDDTDSNGLPLGLNFTVTVSDGAAASGTLKVVLSHYDDEPKNGTDRSDETDVEIDWPVTIEL